MLNTVRATITPAGTIVFDETIQLVRPTAVLVTLLDEQPVHLSASAGDPLAWPLTEEDKRVWDELPVFREQHPLVFNSLEPSE